MSKKSFGDYGEEIAKQYLIKKGYQILKQNYYTRYGEIDLICQKENVIIFVEVKTRSNMAYGYPEDAISKRKKKSLMTCALRYMINKNQPWQVDVVAININKGKKISLYHLENCLEGSS